MVHRCPGRFWIVVLSLLLVSEALAQSWLGVDTRSRAMGSAGVAASEGGPAAYWNPANLARDAESFLDISLKRSSFETDLFVDAEARGTTIETFDALMTAYREDIDGLQAAFDAGTASQAQVRDVFRILGLISDLNDPNSGLIGDAGIAAQVRSGNFAISYRLLSYVAGTAFVDLDRTGLADDGQNDLANIADGLGSNNVPQGTFAATEIVGALQGIGLNAAQANELAYQAEQALGSRLNDPQTQELIRAAIAASGQASPAILENNRSFVILKGVALHEVAFAYGLPLFDGILRIGLAPKIVSGTTFYDITEVSDLSDDVENGEDLFGKLDEILTKSKKTDTRFSLDSGITLAPVSWFEIGVAGKNLIPMDFAFKQPEDQRFELPDFELDPQARAGILLRPPGIKWVKAAADVDLTTNTNSLFPSHQERMLGAGVELSPSLWVFQFGLRGGILTNLAEPDDGRTYTAGLGIRVGVVYLAAEGRISDKQVNIEAGGRDVPTRAGLGVTIGVNVKF